MKNKGFTLIELLIVISLLGTLAVGLLATIDPFEQLKKGRDTSIRSTTSDFYNATVRYYANSGRFPWNRKGTTTTFTGELMNGTIISATAIPELITAGELKNKFYELAGSNNLARIYVSSPATDQIIACFQPESKSFRHDQNVIFNSVGAATNGCISQTANGSTSCYWCIQ